jgi:hypothetical protein
MKKSPSNKNKEDSNSLVFEIEVIKVEKPKKLAYIKTLIEGIIANNQQRE